jgi:hypothetical protein
VPKKYNDLLNENDGKDFGGTSQMNGFRGIWKIAWGLLPKRLVLDNRFPIEDANEDTVEHIFIHCPNFGLDAFIVAKSIL